jgi:parvulin-like peptidyl-prolyl isomerase
MALIVWRRALRRAGLSLSLLVLVLLAPLLFAQAPGKAAPPAAGKPAAPPGAPAGQTPPGTPGVAAPGQPAAPGQEGNLPNGVVARVNGKEVTLEGYTKYLFATVGKSKVREFIDRLLVEEEGRKNDVTLTPEEVEEVVNTQVQRSVQALYQGNADRFAQSLAQRGLTLEEHKAKLRQDTAYKLLEDRLILKNRKVTDDDIQARFQEVYGPGGIQYELRQILISTRPRPAAAGGEARPAPVSDADARAKAEKVLKELQSGADFVQLVRAYSEDELTKRQDGRIPVYRKGYFGPDFDEAVARLTPEAPVSGPVRSPRGYHLIQLVSKKATKLDEKREEITNFLRTREPTVQERNNLRKSLREKAKIEL